MSKFKEPLEGAEIIAHHEWRRREKSRGLERRNRRCEGLIDRPTDYVLGQRIEGGKRIRKIFDLLGTNDRPYSQIVDDFDAHLKYIKQSRVRGNENAAYVFSILGTLEEVACIYETRNHSRPDRKGIDAFVHVCYVDPYNDLRFGEVKVQVVGSYWAATDFRELMANRFRSNSRKETVNRLSNLRFVILPAREKGDCVLRSADAIIEDFRSQIRGLPLPMSRSHCKI